MAAPEVVDPRSDGPWPLATVAASGKPLVVDDITARFGRAFPGGPWPEPATSALVVPIANTARPDTIAGFFVGGINPRRALDDEYRTFVEGVASQLGFALATARAYEEERRRAKELAEIDRAKTAFFSNVSH